MSAAKYFLSFGDKRLESSLARIKRQAEEMTEYDKVFCWNENDLADGFWQKHRAFCKRTRGFGYWMFKPQIVLQVLAEMKNGDILHYCDVGCHLHQYARKRLQQYFDRANNSETGVLAFDQNHKERKWTKGDLFDYFDVRNNTGITSSGQHS